MRVFRILLLLEASPVCAAVFVLVALLISGPEAALLGLWPFVVVTLTGRHVLAWALTSGGLHDDSAVALRFIQSDFRRTAERRMGWLGFVLMLGYVSVGFGSDISEPGLIIGGAILWAFLGGVQLWVLAEFLIADRARHLPAQMASTTSTGDQPKRPEM